MGKNTDQAREFKEKEELANFLRSEVYRNKSIEGTVTVDSSGFVQGSGILTKRNYDFSESRYSEDGPGYENQSELSNKVALDIKKSLETMMTGAFDVVYVRSRLNVYTFKISTSNEFERNIEQTQKE